MHIIDSSIHMNFLPMVGEELWRRAFSGEGKKKTTGKHNSDRERTKEKIQGL
jgi:hypothetical protein